MARQADGDAAPLLKLSLQLQFGSAHSDPRRAPEHQDPTASLIAAALPAPGQVFHGPSSLPLLFLCAAQYLAARILFLYPNPTAPPNTHTRTRIRHNVPLFATPRSHVLLRATCALSSCHLCSYLSGRLLHSVVTPGPRRSHAGGP